MINPITSRFVYTGEQLEGQVAVNVRGQLYSFAKLAELPFDSVRKCMTVIVRDADGIIHVLTKGFNFLILMAIIDHFP